MKLRKAAGWSLLSLLPIGWGVGVFMDGGWPLLVSSFVLVGFVWAIIHVAFRLIDGDR